jgi:hypothetical protein
MTSPEWLSHHSKWRWLFVGGAFGVVILASVVGVVSSGPSGTAAARDSATVVRTPPPPCVKAVVATPILGFGFRIRLPTGWAKLVPIRQTNREVTVTTNRTGQYQIYSPPAKLIPGHYRIRTHFRLTRGGVSIAMLDEQSPQRFIFESEYLSRQSGTRPMTTSGTFYVPRTMPVAIVLSNADLGVNSTWEVRSISVASLGSRCAKANS